MIFNKKIPSTPLTLIFRVIFFLRQWRRLRKAPRNQLEQLEEKMMAAVQLLRWTVCYHGSGGFVFCVLACVQSVFSALKADVRITTLPVFVLMLNWVTPAM